MSLASVDEAGHKARDGQREGEMMRLFFIPGMCHLLSLSSEFLKLHSTLAKRELLEISIIMFPLTSSDALDKVSRACQGLVHRTMAESTEGQTQPRSSTSVLQKHSTT